MRIYTASHHFCAAFRRKIQYLHAAVVLQALPAHAFSQYKRGQSLGIGPLPAGQQVLEPLVVVRVRYAVAEMSTAKLPGASVARVTSGTASAPRSPTGSAPPVMRRTVPFFFT